MSTLAPEQPQPAPPPPAPVAAPPMGAPPRITANRKILVRRFPSLGFTISSGGLPYWEVLLFTDRSLIDPANASRRTPSNFYSSRQDGGLRRATPGGDDLFLVPSAVLRGFAAAVPKPTAICYTIASYATPDGTSPVLPAPPQQLAIIAPSVTVAPDFTPDTIDRAVGIRSARLQVVAQALDAVPVATAPSTAAPAPAPAAPAPAPAPPAPPATPVDPVVDAGAGEDGASYLAQHPLLIAASPQPAPVPPTAQPAQPTQPTQPVQPVQPVQPAPAAPPPAAAPPPRQVARHDDIPYDDGYGSYGDDWNAPGWSPAQEASFPSGSTRPAQLLDSESDDWGDATELHGVAAEYPYRALDDPAPAAAPAAVARHPLKLTIDDKRSVIEKVAATESGGARYSAINPDGEFKGLFKGHEAYQTYHIGLSFGLIQFTQDGGSLGRLLTMMRDRDAAKFREIFGPDSETLIAVTNAPGPSAKESPGGRSARTQPVGGADLWDEPWLTRFRQAGEVPAFQAAQNELAATAYLDPVVDFAGDMGLDTDRGLAMTYDRSVQMGPTAAVRWIAAAVGPISTSALRQQALAALGYSDLGSFQSAWGLNPDNLWGPMSHAGLVGALRQLGSASPIPVPTIDQMLDATVRRAETDGAFWADRVKNLRSAGGFTDTPFAR